VSLPNTPPRRTAVRQATSGSFHRLAHLYYGWWIVIASMCAMLIASTFYWQGFSVFFLPLQNEFNTSRAGLSGAIALSQLEGGMMGPVGGYLVDRFGPRRMMLIGVSIMGLGFLILSQIHSLALFYVVFLGVISVGMSIGIRVPALVAPANWFIRQRGMAIGITLTGSGLGGIFIPVLAWLISDLGWRGTAVVSGLLIWLLGLPLAAVMRGRPEEYGMTPDGGVREQVPSRSNALSRIGPASSGESSEPVLERLPDPEFSLSQALHLRVFWLLAVAFGLRQFAVGAISLHLVPFIVDGGHSLAVGSTVLAAVTVASIPGRLGFGWLADRFAPGKVMAFSMALVALGSFVLISANDAVMLLVLFVLVYSMGWGGGATTMNAVRGAYFGRRAFGTISGTMDFVQMFGLVLGPIYAGYIFDQTQSYTIAFTSFGVSALLAAALMFCLRAPDAALLRESATP
jgi:MFS family permease